MKRIIETLAVVFVPAVLIFAHAESAAAQCAASLDPRKPPVLSITLHAEHDQVPTGSPVPMTILQTNKSDHEVCLGRDVHGSDIVVEATNENGKPATDKRPHYRNGRFDPAGATISEIHHHVMGNAVWITLKPGETYSYPIDVSQLYDLSKPGRYAVTVELSDAESTTRIRSAPTYVNITTK